MTLSQTTLAQNGNNNPSTSKKCTALEEENSCLREKLSNEEQKSGNTKEELKALRKHFEAVEAELLASEESSHFMKKKVTLPFLLSSPVEMVRQTLSRTTKSSTVHLCCSTRSNHCPVPLMGLLQGESTPLLQSLYNASIVFNRPPLFPPRFQSWST
jgi:hypothetical protein